VTRGACHEGRNGRLLSQLAARQVLVNTALSGIRLAPRYRQEIAEPARTVLCTLGHLWRRATWLTETAGTGGAGVSAARPAAAAPHHMATPRMCAANVSLLIMRLVNGRGRKCLPDRKSDSGHTACIRPGSVIAADLEEPPRF